MRLPAPLPPSHTPPSLAPSRYDYPCADSVSQPGSCGLEGGPRKNAARCSADPGCHVMVSFPDGRDYPGPGGLRWGLGEQGRSGIA